MKKIKKIVITQGDPAGIGAEIITKVFLFRKLHPQAAYIVYGHVPELNAEKITRLEQADTPGKLYLLDLGKPDCCLGTPSKSSGEFTLKILERVLIDQQQIDAVVTCPIHKDAIRQTNSQFIGHTEFFAQGQHPFVMSFFGPYFNLALLTTHLALQEIEPTLSEDFFKEKIKIIYQNSQKIAGISRFAMLAVNPHAGENGAFGDIDQKIESWLAELNQSQQIQIDGPFPADTFFAYKAQNYQMVISAYHDQGLVPFKMLSKGKGVNTTLGLPFVRTSVDHGTACDIAGKGVADPGSLEAAIDFAEKCLKLEDEKIATYSLLAPIYDEYMQHVRYQDWADFALSSYQEITGKKPKKILEIACGTANISCLLVKQGYRVVGEDISQQMLEIAQAKPHHPELHLNDMLNHQAQSGFDLALLMFDSLNYLTKEEQISQLLLATHHRTTNEGVFIFDVSTLKNCQDNFDGLLDYQEDGQNFVMQECFLDGDTQVTKFHFFQKNGFLYDAHLETHKQKIYPCQTLVRLIEKSPWQLKGVYSHGKLVQNLKHADSEERLFFVLQKS